MKKAILSFISLILALLMPISSCAETINYAIAQAYQEKENDTRLHIRVESTGAVAGKPLVLTRDDIQEATLGTGDTPVLDVFSVQDTRAGGMTYAFVLDHAMPISKARLDEMKTGMQNWIQVMGENDQVAILVVEEDEIRNVTHGFTSDKNAMLEALDDYGKADESQSRKNMVFSGIRDAILMATTDVSSRPRNCSIVVFSNGADTYQTLVTPSEISELLAKNNLPLYVVGYAYSSKKSSLASLVDIAKNSGGWAEDATPSNDAGPIDEAFDRLRMRICNGYDISLDCSDGFVTNGLMTVALNLANPEVLLKRNVELYLLEKDADELTVSATPNNSRLSTPSAPSNETSRPKVNFESIFENIRTLICGTTNIKGKPMSNTILIILGLCILCILVFGIHCLRKRKNNSDPEPPISNPPTPIPDGPSTDKPTPINTDGQTEVVRPKLLKEYNDPEGTRRSIFKMLHIDKLTLSYTLPGCEEEVRVFDNPTDITIGRLSGNDLILKDMGVSSKHVKISCIEDCVEIENISPVHEKDGQQNRLLLNGIQVYQKTKVSNGSKLMVNSIPMEITWTVTDMLPIDSNNSEPLTLRGDKTFRQIPVKLTATYYIDGREEKHTIPLANSIVIGRHQNDHITIPDMSVSEHHLTIFRNGKNVVLRNTSRNDQFYGKNPIYYENTELLDDIQYVHDMQGMVLYLGSNSIKLVLEISGL